MCVKSKNNRLSKSLKVLIVVGTLATAYTIAVLYLMANREMPEPTSLNLCVYGGLGLTNGFSAYLTGITKKGENKISEIQERYGVVNEQN